MEITYTNRNGRTYYLGVSRTRSGKPRYNFSTEPSENPVDEIPKGYEIRESVNGIVSLARIQHCMFLVEEIADVETVLRSHPEASRYRVSIKHNHLVIHEMRGPSRSELRELVGHIGIGIRPGLIEELENTMPRYSPVMRFVVADTSNREFVAERWCVRRRIDDWIYIGQSKQLKRLARKFIPTLGTDEFYELI